MKKLLIVIVFWALPAFVFAATTFVWQQPSKNTDGTLLTDLKGNKVYCGLSPGQYTTIKDIGLPAGAGAKATYPIASVLPQPDNYYCAVSAYDRSGNESGKSNEINFTTDIAAPDVPGSLEVQ